MKDLYIFPIIKLFLFFILFYYLGFFSGLFIYYITFVKAIDLILYFFFGWEKLTGYSNSYAALENKDKFVLTGYLILNDFKPNEWRKMIIERGINKFPEFRKNIKKFFGNFYWNELPIEKAYENLIEKNIQINSMQELIDFSIKEQSIYYSHNEIQFNFYFIPFKKNQGIIFLKFDHSLCDGVGFLSFLMALADNYDISMFPKFARPTFLMKVYMNIMSPYYTIKSAWCNLAFKPTISPSKKNKTKENEIISFSSKFYNFELFASKYKKMNLTFNDFMMCIFSKSYKSYVKKYSTNEAGEKYNLDYLVMTCPINMRSIPKNISEMKIDNQLGGKAFKLPMIDCIEKEHKTIKRVLDKTLKNPAYNYGSYMLQYIVGQILPAPMMNSVTKNTSNLFDIIFSNVPGPTKPLYYCGSKVEHITVTPTVSIYNNNITIISYNNNFSINLSVSSQTNLNAKEFIEFIELIEQELENYAN